MTHTGERTRAMLAAPLLAVALAATALGAPAAPDVRVPICAAPPTLDGGLTDACWEDAWRSETFYDFELKQEVYTPNPDTTLLLTTDGAWLYAGFHCRHPTPDDMKANVTEHFGGRVFGDECITFFVRPASDGSQHFRYVLNSANVYTLRHAFSDAGTSPTPAWPSATRIVDDGWQAEVALPLFELAGYMDLGELRLNAFRKKIVKEYDAQHVEVGFTESISSLCATDEWLDPAKMARATGIGARLHVPFVANAADVSVGELYEADGGIRYDVSFTLMAMTARGGTAAVEVVERPLDGPARRVARTFDLGAHEVKRVALPVAVENLGQRDIAVTVSHAGGTMPFQTIRARDTSGLQLLRGVTRRNYYTDEHAARILYSVRMPGAALVGKRLRVCSAAGETIVQQSDPPPNGALSVPLDGLPNGITPVTLALDDAEGRTLFGVDVNVTKHPPAPGCEWKIDRRTGGLLADGKPFFPFGFLVGVDEQQYREIAEAGFNTVVWWLDADAAAPGEYVRVAELAGRFGLKLIVRPQKVPSRAADMLTLREHFHGKALERAVYDCRSMLRLKSFLLSGCGALTRQQRNAITAEFFDLHMPAILENVRAVRERPELIGYDTLDEPSFATADMHRDLRRMYLRVNDVDPYHPVFALYSSKIPVGPEATSFSDCLGTDPYWTPGRSLPRGSINWVSTTTAKTVARARAAGQSPWTVLQASLWSDVIKRMLTGPEQVCQTYLALIHGTQAICYFTHGWVAHDDQWQALVRLASQVRDLAPALTAPDPDQAISYTPGTWAPLKGDVPDVQARLIRFPNGGPHVLLAANVRRSPVDVTIRVAGLRDAAVNDRFMGPIGAVSQGAFHDTIEARGVRAYCFRRIEPGGACIDISVAIKALGTEGPVEDGYRQDGRTGMRNIQPNPSFEQATLPDFPDYYWPFDWPAGRRGWRRRTGTADPALTLTTDRPYHGKRCLLLNWPNPDGSVGIVLHAAPQHPAANPYVFSFYARQASAEPVAIRVKAFGRTAGRVTVEGMEWKRYAVQLTVPPKADRHSRTFVFVNGPVYVDAFQIERGHEPTEFQP